MINLALILLVLGFNIRIHFIFCKHFPLKIFCVYLHSGSNLMNIDFAFERAWKTSWFILIVWERFQENLWTRREGVATVSNFYGIFNFDKKTNQIISSCLFPKSPKIIMTSIISPKKIRILISKSTIVDNRHTN